MVGANYFAYMVSIQQIYILVVCQTKENNFSSSFSQTRKAKYEIQLLPIALFFLNKKLVDHYEYVNIVKCILCRRFGVLPPFGK